MLVRTVAIFAHREMTHNEMLLNFLTALFQVFYKFCILWIGHGFAKVWCEHLRDAVYIWSGGLPCQSNCYADAELPWTSHHSSHLSLHVRSTHLCQHFHLKRLKHDASYAWKDYISIVSFIKKLTRVDNKLSYCRHLVHNYSL